MKSDAGHSSRIWWEVHVTAPRGSTAAELAAGLLLAVAPAGLAEAADGWSAFLPDEPAARELAARVREASGLACLVRPVAETDWEAWRYAFRPIDIGRRLRVVPVYDPADMPATGKATSPEAAVYAAPTPTDGATQGVVEVFIEPGLAFGTGEHPTTANCLRYLAEYLAQGMTVLDVGTGSGILALAAAALGATGCLGVDIDPVAVRSAKANRSLNPAIAGRVCFVAADAGDLDCVVAAWREQRGLSGADGAGAPGDGRPGFDIVLANLTTDLIVALLPQLLAAVVSGGLLILSGIGAERDQKLRAALAAAPLKVTATVEDGGWLTILCSKEGPA